MLLCMSFLACCDFEVLPKKADNFMGRALEEDFEKRKESGIDHQLFLLNSLTYEQIVELKASSRERSAIIKILSGNQIHAANWLTDELLDEVIRIAIAKIKILDS